MKSEVLTSHKKYQPERTDILWNTDWGVSKSEMSGEDAQKGNFRLFKDRWVTKPELKILMMQRAVYRTLRCVAAFLMFLGGCGIFGLFKEASVSGLANFKWETTLPAFLVLVGLFLAPSIGLYHFRPWARYVSIFSFLFLFFCAPFVSGGVYLVLILLAILSLICLLRKSSREVFRKGIGRHGAGNISIHGEP